MKNKEIKSKLSALVLISGIRFGSELTIKMAKNKQRLNAAYVALEGLRKDLCVSYAVKKDGEPVIVHEEGKDPYYDMTDEDQILFNDALAKLMEEPAGITLEELDFTQSMAEMAKGRIKEISMEEIDWIDGLVKKEVVPVAVEVVAPVVPVVPVAPAVLAGKGKGKVVVKPKKVEEKKKRR